MKDKIIVLIISLLFKINLSIASNALNNIELDPDKISLIQSIYPNIDMNDLKNSYIFFDFDSLNFANQIQSKKFQIPFFNDSYISFEIDEHLLGHENIYVTRHTSGGQINELYNTKLRTFKIVSDIYSGALTYNNSMLKAVFLMNDDVFVLDSFNDPSDNTKKIYFLSNVANSLVDFEFKCSHDLIEEFNEFYHSSNDLFSNSKCLNVAIEIDYHTYQSFENYQDAVDWALEIIFVSSTIFEEEINIGLNSNSAQVWEYSDPYSQYIDQPQEMLVAIRDNWFGNENFSSIDRDLVHLFSKRTNTGTGGIAFLNGVGSLWNGYGFSSNLTDDLNYEFLPVPFFFWNIYCFIHELGHNLGAKHTQWCGWEGGPIDNCANLEETQTGECTNFIDNPQPQVGTIMSYCHTWSFESGGGIVLKFNNQVKNTILTYVEFQNIQPCTNQSQTIYGCTDDTACNFDYFANINDNTCIYPEIGYDCFGNCLNDFNNDGFCDDDSVDINESIFSSVDVFKFESSNKYQINLNSKFNGTTLLKVTSSVGQTILLKDIEENTVIDLSNHKSGIYNIQLANNFLKKSDIFNKQVLVL